MRLFRYGFSVLLVSAALVACGGGGGDGGGATPAVVAPTITAQPVSTTVVTGQPASFSVTANGSPLNYQWRRNGVNISGATSATYTIAAATAADSLAAYSVVVSNSAGAATSDDAVVTVSASSAALVADTMRTLYYSNVALSDATIGLVYDLTDDSVNFLNPSSVCQTGSLSATFNGSPIQAGADATPLDQNSTLAAVFQNCKLASSPTDVLTGSNSLVYQTTFTSAGGTDTLRNTGTATLRNMRRVVTSSSGDLLYDNTLNGAVGVTETFSVSSSNQVIYSPTFTPAANTVLLDRDFEVAVHYVSGTTSNTANIPSVGSSTVATSFVNQTFKVGAVTYVANGTVTLRGTTSASGEIQFLSNGSLVGRIFGSSTAPYIFVEVNGTVQPLSFLPLQPLKTRALQSRLMSRSHRGF